MTKEGRQDALLIALVASLAIHAGLMYVMRPKVMSRLELGATETRSAAPKMVVTDSIPPPAPVDIAALPDVEALRTAPEAETAATPGLLDPVKEGASEATTEAPPPPEATTAVADLPKPAEEIAPYLAETIHVEKGSPRFTAPDVGETAEVAAPVAAAAPAPVTGPVTPETEVPMFTAPTYVPETQAEKLTEHLADVRPPDPPAPEKEATKDFTPVQTVLDTVDEKLVEAEKSAVHDLLNVRDAAEMSPVLNVNATSAKAGDWLYFQVKFTPSDTLEVVPKDVVVLLDASGSIGDDRLKSCRSAARKILRSCTNTGDRFNLVAFRDKFSYAFKTWQDCNQPSFDAADKWLNRLASHGRTDVFASAKSLLTLPRDPGRPLIALMVTDGDANTGVSETADILARFSALNDGLISVYMYGVKASANRELIDVLTHGNRGESFIYGGSRWNAGAGIEGLSERFRDPVLTDLRVVFASGVEAEIYPRLLRNVYRGETVDFIGRVPANTPAKTLSFSLKGLNGKKAYEGFFDVDLSGVGFDHNLPAAWFAEKAVDAKLR